VLTIAWLSTGFVHVFGYTFVQRMYEKTLKPVEEAAAEEPAVEEEVGEEEIEEVEEEEEEEFADEEEDPEEAF